ncbi:hypothetical protein SLS58_001885 [Diplodia intermedia]|uniref:DUF6594 domain-containing protein n=1 Tax=Diplodia intermedia TaxID=856260 RepID=A0ABR3U139_9PEZI
MPEASIFRSFATLNIQNLLYMQAELVCLEDELRAYQLADACAGEESLRRKYASNWYYLSRSTSEDASIEEKALHDGSQWRTVEEIREKLQRYNSAILQTMQVLSAPEPSAHDLRDIQEYLRSREMRDGGALSGKDASVWGCVAGGIYARAPAGDLITLLARPACDRLTQSVVNAVVGRLHKRKGRFHWPRGGGATAVFVDDKMIYRLTFVATSGVAAMLPVASMVALQRVEDVPVRALSLGLVALFNFVLAVLLTWWADVKRAEVFAVAAAFAAVNVVFITK